MMLPLRALLEGLIHALRETIELRRAARRRRAVADSFNRANLLHASRLSLWMCPSCNRIHPALGANPLDLPDFPACCEHERGSRTTRVQATGLPQS